MAEPLLSLLTPGTMKHVVPWKTRLDFLSVYQDLYSDDVKSQESAIGRILAWKSRAGNKLSVAIESSASLMQVRMQHLQAEKDGNLRQIEPQLCSSYSLALIRFVNHMTEKAQTKAVAQPVHLIAREFGIPEWIVRLRHDATHSSLPCLDALASGTKWALDYLQQNFWEQQKISSHANPANEDNSVNNSGTNVAKDDKSPKTADMRRAFYEFQKIRCKRSESGSETNIEKDHAAILGRLQKFMFLDHIRFVRCLLEDGILIATEEQLQIFGIDPAALVETSPPTIPEQMALLWRPLLKCMKNAGILPVLLHTAMFLVTSEHGLRNYQLVAWIAFILANTSYSESNVKGRQRRHGRQECFMRTNTPLPTRMLYSACIQNLNMLTVHLLRYLIDQDNVGREVYDKLRQQLHVAPPTLQQTEDSKATEENAKQADISSSSDSDSDTVYTSHDCKRSDVEEQGHRTAQISTTTVENIKKIIGHGHVSWNICADAVDWSKIPLGMLPDQIVDAADECVSGEGDDIDDNDDTGRSNKQGRRRRRRERRGDRGIDEDDEEEDEEDEESDDPDQHTSPKRSKLIVTDDLLI